jgi:hypothetical protein
MHCALVVADCCRRFVGGGETPLSLELGRFARPGRLVISHHKMANKMLKTSSTQYVGGDARRGGVVMVLRAFHGSEFMPPAPGFIT